MSALGEDPAVTAWRLALAGSWPSAPSRRHWWRDYVTDAFRTASQAWFLEAEAFSCGNAAELAEFRALKPPPNLRDFLVHLGNRRGGESS